MFVAKIGVSSLTEPSSYHGRDTDFIIPVQISLPTIRPDSILEDPDGDSSQLQCLSECYHDNLKNVMITGFCSAKSMVELTIHIMQKARSLDCLTLDTTRGHDRGLPTLIGAGHSVRRHL